MGRPATPRGTHGFIRLIFLPIVVLLLPIISSGQQNTTSAASGVAAQPRITAAIDENRLTTLRGNTHPLARPEFDRGAAPASLPMQRMLLVLKRGADQEAALDQLLQEQQDASSPNYHKWLTPQQFGQRFGPADQDIQTITSWLQSHGFQIASVSNGRTVIEFSGTAGQVREAFHAEIHKFTVNGEEHWANTADPQIPVTLAPVVAGVWTLHNFLRKPYAHLVGDAVHAKVTPGANGGRPQVTFSGSPPLHALGPADFATIYNFNPNYQPSTGFFPRIGVVARSNINTEDVVGFNSYLPLNSINRVPSPAVILNGPDPGDLGGGEEVEAVLDASWSGALLANNSPVVLLVVSASTYNTDGVDLSELYIVDNNFADVMMESFGDCEANFTSAEATGISNLAQQAAAMGITYTVSTGDSGAEGCDDPNQEQVASGPLSANILASTPYTVAVGGTQFNENGSDSTYWNSTNAQLTLGSALKYIPEDVWNQSCSTAQCAQNANILAGGGGVSSFFSKPSWQSAVPGIPGDGARDLPDVSLTAASHDPYLICLDGSCVPNSQGEIQFVGVYGTSSANAAFAGIMALVDLTMGSRQGQANYVLYRLAAAENLSQCNGSNVSSPPNIATCVFNDVTVGNNAVPGETGFGTSSAKYQSGAGYDLAAGLGSVDITNLMSNWGSARSKPSAVTNFTLNPTSGITHGSPVTVNITVAPRSGTGGIPTGDVSAIANIGPTGTGMDAVDHFTLVNGTVAATTTLLPGGNYTVTAHYEGDGNYTSSDFSPPIPVSIAPETSQTQVAMITFDPNTGRVTNSNATSASFGSPYTLRVTVSGTSGQGCPQTVSGGVGCPTGTVTLKDSGLPLDGAPPGSGSYLLNSGGFAEDQSVQLLAGIRNLVASYPGDNSFGSSTSAPDSVNITPAPTTISVVANSAGVAVGSSVTLTATVSTQSNSSPLNIYPTGSVRFMSGGNTIGSIPVTGSANSTTGFAQASAVLMTTLPSGQDVITATYLGDSNYAASSLSAPITISVLPSTTTLVTSSNSTVAQGSSVMFTATVTATQDGGPAPTGTVQFSSNGSKIGSTVSLSNGQAQITTTSLPVGSDQITAAYSGDTNYAGSTSAAITETVNPAPTFTVAANPTTVSISAPGQSGSTALTLTSQNGLTGTGGLGSPTCGIATSEEVTCSLTSFTLPSNGSVQSTLSFLTTAASMTLPTGRNRPLAPRWKTIGAAAAVVLLLCLVMTARGSQGKRRRLAAVFTCAAFAILAMNAGCGGGGGGGGGGGNPGTPVGNVPVNVTITINGVTQTVPNLIVNVQ